MTKFLRSSLFVSALFSLPGMLAPLTAQTIWDGGGGGNTTINLADNWDNNLLPANNGTASVQFGTGGSLATLNVDYYFRTLTFNRNDSAGFTINGPGTLSINSSSSGSTSNLIVSDTAGNGTTTINANLRINTDGASTRLLVIENREAGTSGESLLITNGISSSNSTNAYGMRFGGSGSTRISGAITGTVTSNLQQALISGQNMAGTVTIAGNQSLGSAQVNIAGTGSGSVASSAKFVMGDNTADVQSWGSTTVNQNATVEVRSSATTGAIALSNAGSAGSSGGTLNVTGNLSATTLAIGGAAYSGILRVSGNAAFSGAITTGATAGSKIVGGGSSSGTLTLSSGTIGSSVTIGGGGTNENNVGLVKASTGSLNINGTNTYSGGTTIVDGGAGGSFAIALGANNALGSGPLVLGSTATGTNGARFRMNGFNQTVSALSTGNTANARVIENFGSSNSLLTVNQSSNTTFAGILRDRTTGATGATGVLGLTKSGAGVLTLSGSSSTYTGVTTLSGGVLEVASFGTAGLARTVSTTASSNIVTVDDTTGLSAGMTFSAATLPAGFTILSIDSATQITISTNSNIATGTGVAAVFGVNSSIGMATSDASNLVFDGGTLRYTGGNSTSNRNFTINGTKTARFDVSTADATLTLSGNTSAGSGSLEKLGAGTLALTGSNGYTGGTTLSAGTLAVNSNASLGASSGNLTFAGNSTLATTADISSSRNYAINSSVSATIDTAAATTLSNSGLISGAGNLVKQGAGTLTLAGNNTYTGTTTIGSGTLQIGDGADSGSLASTSAITNTGSLVHNVGAGNRTLGAVISGTGNLVQNGSGILALTGNNTYNGTTTINSGTLAIGNGSDSGSIVSTSAITNNGSLVHNVGAGNRALSAVISGTGSVSQNGTGTLTLSGNNSYSGGTTLNAGTISVNSNSSLGDSSGNLTFAGNSTLATTANILSSRNYVINPSVSATINTAASTTLTNNGVISGDGALTKTGTGALVLNGANTYTGGTTIVDGGGLGSFAVALGASNALGSGPLVIGSAASGSNGVRFRMNGFSQTVSALSSGNTTRARVIENFGSSNSLLTINQSSNTTYAGILRDRSTGSAGATGVLGLTKSGEGVLTLSGSSSTYTGVTTLSGGVLEVASFGTAGLARTVTTTASSNVVTVDDTTGLSEGMTFSAATLPAGASIVSIDSPTQITINTSSNIATGTGVAAVFGVNSSIGMATGDASNLVFDGGTLRYTGGNSTSDRNFTINGSQTARFDVSNADATLTISGNTAAGSGSLQKLGAGTLSLSGSNGYSGTTTVLAGTLKAAGANALGSTTGIAVATDATLEVTAAGAVSDTAAISLDGGRIFRGTGVSETFGSLTLTSGSLIDFGTTGTGTLSFGTYTGGGFKLTVSNFLAGNVLTFKTDLSSSISNPSLFEFTNGFTSAWDSGSTTFTITAVPEPSAVIAAILFLGLICYRERRRIQALFPGRF